MFQRGVFASPSSIYQWYFVYLSIDIVMTSNLKTAFTDVDLVIMLASVSLTKKQDYNDHLTSMVKSSRVHGAAIDKYAKKTVKVTLFTDDSV